MTMTQLIATICKPIYVQISSFAERIFFFFYGYNITSILFMIYNNNDEIVRNTHYVEI
jgi:hypothetical protein